MRLLVLATLSFSIGCTYDFDSYLPASGADAGRTDTGTTTDGGGGTCSEAGSKTYNGHCYFPTSKPAPFADAKAACEAAGAHLVTVGSGGEESIVESIGSGDRWLGLSRSPGTPSRADSFKWITGEPMSYLRWGGSQPSGAGECGRVRSFGSWGDANCSDTLIGICER